MRSLTPIETAAAIAIFGSVTAVAVPAFFRNLHASQLVEPIDGLTTLAMRASALAASRPAAVAYPPSVPLTPEQVPRGEAQADPPGSWDHSTWRQLDFSWTRPHSFAFEFVSENKPEQSKFTARAHGDLDGDGVFSTFEIAGKTDDKTGPVTFPLESYREVE